MSTALYSCGWLSECKLNIMNELLYASQAQTENTMSPCIHLTYNRLSPTLILKATNAGLKRSGNKA